MRFDMIAWSFDLCGSGFDDKMRSWIDEHPSAEIIDISYQTPTNEHGIIVNIFAFILYRED